MRIEHANLTVRDIAVSADFYRRLLGFATRWEGMASGSNGPVRAMHVGTPDTYLSLFEAEQEGRAPASYGSVGFNHLCFEVADLQTYRSRLEQLGVSIHLEADYEPGQRIYFYDPDGVEIELVQY